MGRSSANRAKRQHAGHEQRMQLSDVHDLPLSGVPAAAALLGAGSRIVCCLVVNACTVKNQAPPVNAACRCLRSVLGEATTGFEPVIAVLQTAALPLGYVAGVGGRGIVTEHGA